SNRYQPVSSHSYLCFRPREVSSYTPAKKGRGTPRIPALTSHRRTSVTEVYQSADWKCLTQEFCKLLVSLWRKEQLKFLRAVDAMGLQFKNVKATVLLYVETGYPAPRTVRSNRAIFCAVSFHKPIARFFL